MAVGRCQICDAPGIAYDALVCPYCGGLKPNPSSKNRWAFYGGILGAGVGVAYCFLWKIRPGFFELNVAIGAVSGAAVFYAAGLLAELFGKR